MLGQTTQMANSFSNDKIYDELDQSELSIQKKKIILISNLPSQNHDHDGIGFYTGFFVKNASRVHYKVLCQLTKDESKNWDEQEYGENIVQRSFDKNSLWSVFPLLTGILRIRFAENIPNLHIQYEFFSYTSSVGGAIFTILIALWGKSLGMNVVITLHQIPSLGDLRERLNKELQARFFYSGICGVFWILNVFCNKIVVHEEVFKNRLIKTVKIKSSKIAVIPHLSYKNDTPVENVHLEKLYPVQKYPNKLLFFGYLSWYKGLDTMIKDFLSLPKDMADKTALIISGGLHPKQINDPEYLKWLQELKDITAGHDNIIWYGFVDQVEVETLFKSVTGLILSYRNMFSSSGPFAWALAYHLPVIASGIMEYLAKEGILTYHDTAGFVDAVKKLEADPQKYVDLAKRLNDEHSVANIELRFSKLYI